MNNTAQPAQPANKTEPLVKLNIAQLRRVFAQIVDPRLNQPNLRYPLPALLLAALVGLLCQQLTQLALAQWLADQPLAIKQALGFADGKTPHQSTFNRLFRRLDLAALETDLSRLYQPKAKASQAVPVRASQAIAIDGKALRTKAKFNPGSLSSNPTCHLLSLFSHQSGLVLAQIGLTTKEAELTVAPQLLSRLGWRGRVLTGDAMFCQRNLCTQVVEAGGDYFFAVKANQPRLSDDIRLVFEEEEEEENPTQTELSRFGLLRPVPLAIETGRKVSVGHGRVEVRTIKVSSELADYSDWPYLAQVVELKRSWENSRGAVQKASWLGVTSLPASVASPNRLLKLKQQHWGIENRLHWIRDVVFREDQATLHKGSGGQLWAILRNLALNLIRVSGNKQISQTLRQFARQPQRVLALLGVELNA